MRGRPTNGEEDVAEGVQQVQLVTMERRIKRLERERDHPGPDPEMMALWASLWTAAGLEESRAKAAALEFLVHCQATEQTATIAALNKWTHCESAG